LSRNDKSKSNPVPPPALGIPMPPMPPAPGMPAPPLQPVPGVPMPPMPPLPQATVPAPVVPPASLPPEPALVAPIPEPALPPVPVPEATTPLPAPLPAPVAPLPAVAEPVEGTNDYQKLWAKRSEKPLQQIYGHIDRISNADAGSLLDRYADRFGHSLDREIIVLRKNEHEKKVAVIREAPTVTLLEEEGQLKTESESLSLEDIEQEIRRLKPLYQRAKENGQSDDEQQLKATLQNLLQQRKSMMEPTVAKPSNDESDQLFLQFFSIVDSLLESSLPEHIAQSFIESESFGLYMLIGQNFSETTNAQRSEFVSMIDKLLENIGESDLDAFTQSSDFEIYKEVVIKYSR